MNGDLIHRPRFSLRRTALTLLVALGDAFVIFDAFASAYLLRFHLHLSPYPADPAPVDEYLTALVVVVYSWILLFLATGLYDFSRRRSTAETIGSIVKTVSAGTLVILSLTFFYRHFTFSRLVCLYAWGISIVLFSLYRLALERVRARRLRSGLDVLRLAVVGSRSLARGVIDKIQNAPELGYRVIGVIDDAEPPPSFDLPYLGATRDLEAILERHDPGGVLIAHPTLGHFALLKVIEACERRGVSLRMVPPTFDLMVNYRDFEEADGIPLVRINEQEYRQWSDLVKRSFDTAAAAFLLLLSAPILALAAILIRVEDRGPVLFHQRRVGKDGRPFTMFKLRTMCVHAEELLPQLVDVRSLSEPVFKLEEDPRVTRVGRFLRRTSIDELPQLLNVLRGEMSLVGPRPEEEGLVRRYNVWERRRLKSLPGITGLQQVECRGSPSLRERVRWDVLYLRKRSLLLDLWILLRTVGVVLGGKGAR